MLKVVTLSNQGSPRLNRFSPVAGILFVERPRRLAASAVRDPGFSPVAGILFVESKSKGELAPFLIGFSPVAGILFVERPIAQTQSERGFCQRFSSASFSSSLQPRLLQPVRNKRHPKLNYKIFKVLAFLSTP